MTELIIEIPKNEWLSANRKYHWAAKAARTRAIRARAMKLAQSEKLVVPTPTLVAAEIGFLQADKGKADPDNAQPSIKPCLDGLTDAGVWPDDNSRHVVEVAYRRGPKSPKPGWYTITLKFIPQSVPF